MGMIFSANFTFTALRDLDSVEVPGSEAIGHFHTVKRRQLFNTLHCIDLKWIPCPPFPPQKICWFCCVFVLWMICLLFLSHFRRSVWMRDFRSCSKDSSESRRNFADLFFLANWTEAFEQYVDHWFLTGSWLYPQMLERFGNPLKNTIEDNLFGKRYALRYFFAESSAVIVCRFG